MFKNAAKFLGIKRVTQKMATDFADLKERIKRDKVELCDKEQSSPLFAWSNFLTKYKDATELTEDVRRVILAAMVIPMGNAQGN